MSYTAHISACMHENAEKYVTFKNVDIKNVNKSYQI